METAMSGGGRLYQPRNPDWERVVRESFARQAYMGLIGARLAELHPGRVTIELPYRDDLCQQRGFLHGGVTTAIADSAAGYAAFTLMPANSSPLTVELKVNLLAPAVGERFFATAQVLRSGRTLSIVDADVFAEADGLRKPIAKMLTTLICLKNTSDTRERAAL
jgi:uncharacterized protein (TIGR00369 family)